MRAVNAPAAAMNTTAIINAPLPPNLESSAGVAGVFVCISGVFGGVAFVRMMFVGLADTAGGGGFDAVIICGGLVGAGLNVVRESRLVPTFVPTMTSGGAVTTGRGGGGGGLVVADAAG